MMAPAMAAVPMEAQTAQPSSDASSATYPRWVMLRKDMQIELQGSSCSMSGGGATASNKTLAAARTSTGHLIQVSLLLKEPPGVSSVCLQIPGGLDSRYSRVVAAHGDSVLIVVALTEKNKNPQGYAGYHATDHFVYSAGAAAADHPRPPLLSLLPPFDLNCPTGLVRRGDDVVVVAQVANVSAGPDTPELMREADLAVFCSGEWTVKRVQIRFRNASEVREEFPLWDAFVPIGDGLLCWVDQWRLGVLLCDILEETPRLQYLRLPIENICGESANRNVCATAGGDALKFVNIFPRCCCGGAGASSCQRSSHAYTIQIWTMRIGNDDMEWVKDAIVDASELWALDSYKGLRRFPLDHPVVSLDEPEVIFFWLHEPPDEDNYTYYRDKTVDVLMVNTRSKTIHSVSRFDAGLLLSSSMGDGLLPSNVSYFFNSYERKEETDRPPPVIVDEQLKSEDNASNLTMLQPASLVEPSIQASEIFEAFQEIPSYGLDLDELKVYRILSRDNCRRFRSLLRLPKDLRKDWLLMEIKASEA